MTPPLTRRLLFMALPLAGCLPPQPPLSPTPAAQAAPPPPVLASLAAFATVRFLDPGTRHAVLETSGGSVLDMTGAPGMRNFGALRQGSRVVVEYDAAGTVRIAPVARLDREGGGRIRATLREVEPGGAYLVLAGADGVAREVALRDRPMMAFATRLRPGDLVAVTLEPEAAP